MMAVSIFTMKLYLLKGTKGSWDSFEQFNVGIFSSIEEAEKEKKKLIQELTVLKAKYTSAQIEQYEDEIDDIYYNSNVADDDDSIKLPDYLEEFRNWEYRFRFEGFNLDGFKIDEMELNKSYFTSLL